MRTFDIFLQAALSSAALKVEEVARSPTFDSLIGQSFEASLIVASAAQPSPTGVFESKNRASTLTSFWELS